MRQLRKAIAATAALIAVAALAAPAASAQEEHEFVSETEPTVITGHQETPNAFTFGGGLAYISCESLTVNGTEDGLIQDTITLNPAFGSASAPTGCAEELTDEEATVRPNHCAFALDTDTDGNGHAQAMIECGPNEPAGTGRIVISVPGIETTLSVGPQTLGGGVHYTNIENGDVTVTWTATGIDYECEGALCFLLNGEDGTYTGSTDLEGFEDEGELVTCTGPTTGGNFKEGEPVSIAVE